MTTVPPELLLFDVDGVLLDSMGFWHQCGSILLKELGFAPDPSFDARVATQSIPQTAEMICREYRVNLTPQSAGKLIVRIARNFYCDEVQLKAGVAEAVQRLSATGKYRMAIATAGETELVQAALTRLRIRQYFSDILCCRELGAGKNSPLFYQRLAEHFGIPAVRTVVIEDSLYAAETARSSGCRVIGVYDPPSDSDWEKLKAATHASVIDLSLLPEVLAKI